MRTLLWFRGKDLRLTDHAALGSALGAARAGDDVLPVFVLDPYFFAPARAQQTPHRMQFLLESIEDLAQSIAALGSRLLLCTGKSHEVIPELVRRWRVERVVAQAWVWPVGRERDRRVREKLSVPFELFEGETLLPPGSLRTGGGTPYNVFTPFARAFENTAQLGKPTAAPSTMPPLPRDVAQDDMGQEPLPTLETLGITRNPALQRGGERAARERLDVFLKAGAAHYHERRDLLAQDGTSRLSADLKFGTLSVREVWVRARRGQGEGRRVFCNELLWREFCHSTLWDRPELVEHTFQAKFEGFPWLADDAGWRAWQSGTTGYPVVDASARQLLAEGFVHNRARMISASFLAKHLLADYRLGEAHYMRYLTDGDTANNNAGWQWSAGSGCDAQPYFRIFNPVTQGKKFDPEGQYVSRYVPELANLPPKYIHNPWQAPPEVLAKAGIKLGKNYPHPIIDHATARDRFLKTAREHFEKAHLPWAK